MIGILSVGMSTSVFAVNNNEESNKESKENTESIIRNQYYNDPQFIDMVKNKGDEYGEEFIQNAIEFYRPKIQTRGGGGGYCYQSVPAIRQTKGYNCGSATTLQTLYGLNSEDKVPGNTDAEKIKYIDDKYDVDGQGTLIVWQIMEFLNLKNKGNQEYIYTKGDTQISGEYEFACSVANSLTNCKPVILHTYTRYISYYGGDNYKHYISLDRIDRNANTVRLVDCHTDDDYFGYHYGVSISDAYDAISKVPGRYVIW